MSDINDVSLTVQQSGTRAANSGDPAADYALLDGTLPGRILATGRTGVVVGTRKGDLTYVETGRIDDPETDEVTSDLVASGAPMGTTTGPTDTRPPPLITTSSGGGGVIGPVPTNPALSVTTGGVDDNVPASGSVPSSNGTVLVTSGGGGGELGVVTVALPGGVPDDVVPSSGNGTIVFPGGDYGPAGAVTSGAGGGELGVVTVALPGTVPDDVVVPSSGNGTIVVFPGGDSGPSGTGPVSDFPPAPIDVTGILRGGDDGPSGTGPDDVVVPNSGNGTIEIYPGGDYGPAGTGGPTIVGPSETTDVTDILRGGDDNVPAAPPQPYDPIQAGSDGLAGAIVIFTAPAAAPSGPIDPSPAVLSVQAIAVPVGPLDVQ
jgi:hypothetical protein